MNHTALLKEQRQRWENQGHSVLTEGQNSFHLRGSSAILAGNPDLLACATIQTLCKFPAMLTIVPF